MTIDERRKSHSAAAAGNVTAVNADFRSVVDRIRAEKSSSDGGMTAAFERWFDSHWLVVDKIS